MYSFWVDVKLNMIKIWCIYIVLMYSTWPNSTTLSSCIYLIKYSLHLQIVNTAGKKFTRIQKWKIDERTFSIFQFVTHYFIYLAVVCARLLAKLFGTFIHVIYFKIIIPLNTDCVAIWPLPMCSSFNRSC